MINSKTEIIICLGSSCFSRGNRESLELMRDYLTENKLEDMVIFKGQLCSQSCNKGPVIWIDGKKYEDVRPDTVVPLLDTVFSLCHE